MPFDMPCIIGRNTKEATESLDLTSNDLIEQFLNNKIKTNLNRFHFLTSSNFELKIYKSDDNNNG